MKLIKDIVCCALMCLIFTSCGSVEKQPSIKPTPAPTPEPTPVIFESDKLINDILVKYNNIAETPFTAEEITKGNIKTKAHISNDLIYMTIVNSSHNNFLSIKIEYPENNQIYPVYRDLLLAIDKDLTVDDIEKSWQDIHDKYYGINHANSPHDNSYLLKNIQLQHQLGMYDDERINIIVMYE